MERLRDKKGRQSPEGRAADAIFEIRVTGHPSWDAERIEVVVLLLCVRADFSAIVGDNEGATADGVWLEQKDRWTRLCEAGLASAGPRISSIELSVELLEEMTAAAYLDSDTLDLGGMSPQPY